MRGPEAKPQAGAPYSVDVEALSNGDNFATHGYPKEGSVVLGYK